MPTVLDDDDELSIRDDDKTRQLVLPVRDNVIDDLGGAPDTVASALPPPSVLPFVEPPRAPPPRRRSLPSPPPKVAPAVPSVPAAPAAPAAPTATATATASPDAIAEATTPRSVPAVSSPSDPAPPREPKGPADDISEERKLPHARMPAPPLPPLPNATRPQPAPEASASGDARHDADDAAPTIVVKPSAHVPSSRQQLRREATVVVRRAVRKSRRSPVLTASIFGAVVVLGAALVYTGYLRYREMQDHERRIEQRFEALQRSQGR